MSGNWRPNPGHCPPEAAGKYVRVRFANGELGSRAWPADGRSGLRWSLTGHPYDIAKYEVES